MNKSRGPVRGFWDAALLVAGGCLLLWFAVQLIQLIWVWLLVGALVAGLIWCLVVWWRWRQSRW